MVNLSSSNRKLIQGQPPYRKTREQDAYIALKRKAFKEQPGSTHQDPKELLSKKHQVEGSGGDLYK